jgi:demethylmacrocin O-methyltransferase
MQQFDIIIDDGGHTMNQQRISFMNLLSLVRSGGLYVIEDLETSYNPTYITDYSNSSTTIGLIKILVDEIQQESPIKTINTARNILSFEIADGICFFTRK